MIPLPSHLSNHRQFDHFNSSVLSKYGNFVFKSEKKAYIAEFSYQQKVQNHFLSAERRCFFCRVCTQLLIFHWVPPAYPQIAMLGSFASPPGIFAGKKLHPYRRSVHPHAISFSGTRFFCAVLFWARPICPLFGPVFSQLEALTGGPSRLHDGSLGCQQHHHYETSREISTFARGPTIGVHVAWYFQASIHAVNSEKQSSLTMMQDKKHRRYR